jgi:hypothetical protein
MGWQERALLNNEYFKTPELEGNHIFGAAGQKMFEDSRPDSNVKFASPSEASQQPAGSVVGSPAKLHDSDSVPGNYNEMPKQHSKEGSFFSTLPDNLEKAAFVGAAGLVINRLVTARFSLATSVTLAVGSFICSEAVDIYKHYTDK